MQKNQFEPTRSRRALFFVVFFSTQNTCTFFLFKCFSEKLSAEMLGAHLLPILGELSFVVGVGWLRWLLERVCQSCCTTTKYGEFESSFASSALSSPAPSQAVISFFLFLGVACCECTECLAGRGVTLPASCAYDDDVVYEFLD